MKLFNHTLQLTLTYLLASFSVLPRKMNQQQLLDNYDEYIARYNSELAESVDGLNTELSVKDEYGERKHMAFHEERVKDFMIFKTSFDGYINAFIQASLKEAIEEAGLKGLYFTPDLGDPFSAKHGKKLQTS